MKHVGVVVIERGSAIVHVEHDGAEDRDELLVTAVERLPFSLAAVAERVAELDREILEMLVVIDAEGLGTALWSVLAPDDKQRWQLYSGRGLERQALVDRLLVAVHEGRFHFAPNLPEQEAMTKALQHYRRQVRDDGVVGSELVVALLLALTPPPPPPAVPLIAWGAPLFGRRDEADGTRVSGFHLVRTPDGSLVGIQEPRESGQ